jgi:hypothetical protein
MRSGALQYALPITASLGISHHDRSAGRAINCSSFEKRPEAHRQIDL